MSDLLKTDATQRFMFDTSDARGELASLEHSYADVLAKHAYPQPVQQLLGELMAAAALLVGNQKIDGLLSLQARSEGPVPLLMIECTSDREIRGLARFDADQIAADATLADLLPNGVLAITIDPVVGKRYQGIVDLNGETLADCFTNYFVMSEQVPTRFWLVADGKRARGMFLQNAVNVGATGGLMASCDRLDLFFGLITPHGLLELSCIFVAAAAGPQIFWAWVAPGRRPRGAALASEGRALATVASQSATAKQTLQWDGTRGGNRSVISIMPPTGLPSSSQTT